MAIWQDLEDQVPELAAAGRLLLFHPGFGFGYLATVNSDGSPRIHPINPFLHAGSLWFFAVPSPKLEDLRRRRRFALHSAQDATVDDEFMVTGEGLATDDPGARRRALADCPTSVGEDHVLVELTIDRVMWGHFEHPGAWPPHYRTWKADR